MGKSAGRASRRFICLMKKEIDIGGQQPKQVLPLPALNMVMKGVMFGVYL